MLGIGAFLTLQQGAPLWPDAPSSLSPRWPNDTYFWRCHSPQSRVISLGSSPKNWKKAQTCHLGAPEVGTQPPTSPMMYMKENLGARWPPLNSRTYHAPPPEVVPRHANLSPAKFGLSQPGQVFLGTSASGGGGMSSLVLELWSPSRTWVIFVFDRFFFGFSMQFPQNLAEP